MDPLSASASVVALLQLASAAISYIHCSKGDPEERSQLLSQIPSMSGLLMMLQDQLDEDRDDVQWSSSLRLLNSQDGPLDQFRASLDTLVSKLESAKGLAKVGKTLAWPLQKKVVTEILNSLERQKRMLSLFRQDDHM